MIYILNLVYLEDLLQKFKKLRYAYFFKFKSQRFFKIKSLLKNNLIYHKKKVKLLLNFLLYFLFKSYVV